MPTLTLYERKGLALFEAGLSSAAESAADLGFLATKSDWERSTLAVATFASGGRGAFFFLPVPYLPGSVSVRL